MAKYAFFSFPAYGHVNPTLAIVQELIARGEEVIYYLTPQFREAVEATGATLQAYEFKLSSVPQLEVLSRASIFLSHGGMNSTMESLYYGVPLIVIPQMMEQEITAQRVQELGLGIALDRTTVTADALHEAVEQVAHHPTFRTQAQAMQQKIHKAGGYQRATDAIMQFARTTK